MEWNRLLCQKRIRQSSHSAADSRIKDGFDLRNEFEKDYRVMVCDGSAWEMRLRHSDNTVSLIEGTVEFPTHGEEIEKYIRTAIDQAFILIDPMIFGCTVYDEEDEE